VRPGWWALTEILAATGATAPYETPEQVFAAVCGEVPFYGPTAYEEIGGRGLRWAERDPGKSWTPPDVGGTGPAAPSTNGSGDSGLVLGTYRDLWATDVTKRNPALRFLMPKQKLELAKEDAASLQLLNGDDVTVSVNGHSVEATVAVRERMRPGAGFLIEGTDEANGNVLANGVPQRVEVTKREPVLEVTHAGAGAGEGVSE
jgi:predicted molibdopterin-dependent oxidoreductase YjgC